jgi:integrase
MRTRGYGEGTIRHRPDGRWEARLRDKDGTRHLHHFYGSSRREVQLKMLNARRDRDRGKVLTGSRLTVGKFLEQWLNEVARQRVRGQTFKRYRELTNVHLIPALGRIPLDKLGPAEVQALLNAQSAGGLAPRTVHHVRAVLHNALNQAFRWSLVLRNVAELVDPPRVQEAERRTLTATEAALFLTAIRGEPLEAAYVLGLSLGLRMGEVLGLRWDDVDLEGGTLTVRGSLQRIDHQLVIGEPKTSRSRRTIPLPSVAMAALLDHRARQQQAKVQPGPPWQRLVFTTPHGGPLDGSKVVRAFQRRLEIAGLPRIRFHDLRHSCASLLFAQGVPAKAIQEILGHSRIGTTLDVYTHIDRADRGAPSVLREAAAAMDRLMEGGTHG